MEKWWQTETLKTGLNAHGFISTSAVDQAERSWYSFLSAVGVGMANVMCHVLMVGVCKDDAALCGYMSCSPQAVQTYCLEHGKVAFPR